MPRHQEWTFKVTLGKGRRGHSWTRGRGCCVSLVVVLARAGPPSGSPCLPLPPCPCAPAPAPAVRTGVASCGAETQRDWNGPGRRPGRRLAVISPRRVRLSSSQVRTRAVLRGGAPCPYGFPKAAGGSLSERTFPQGGPERTRSPPALKPGLRSAVASRPLPLCARPLSLLAAAVTVGSTGIRVERTRGAHDEGRGCLQTPCARLMGVGGEAAVRPHG